MAVGAFWYDFNLIFHDIIIVVLGVVYDLGYGFSARFAARRCLDIARVLCFADFYISSEFSWNRKADRGVMPLCDRVWVIFFLVMNAVQNQCVEKNLYIVNKMRLSVHSHDAKMIKLQPGFSFVLGIDLPPLTSAIIN